MKTIEDAIELAVNAHSGQKDKQGQPYILHVLRVMLQFTERDDQMAAVLHDVVEDTSVTLDDLRAAGYPSAVVHAVEALTRKEGERYSDFIERCKSRDIAKRVKLADVRDNMGRMTEELSHLEERYRGALKALA